MSERDLLTYVLVACFTFVPNVFKLLPHTFTYAFTNFNFRRQFYNVKKLIFFVDIFKIKKKEEKVQYFKFYIKSTHFLQIFHL